jgi:hypothetical protein
MFALRIYPTGNKKDHAAQQNTGLLIFPVCRHLCVQFNQY